LTDDAGNEATNRPADSVDGKHGRVKMYIQGETWQTSRGGTW